MTTLSKTTLDVYWSFRSPYSYMATERLVSIRDAYDVAFRLRIVRPLALREDGFFKRARPQFVPYLLRDMMRESERLSIPITMPRPDPIVMDMATGEVADDQPYIMRLFELGFAAEAQGPDKGLDFARTVSRLVWTGTENWHEGDYLANAAREAGLDIDTLERWAQENRADVSEMLAANEAVQMKHHWGVPLMVVNDEEPFFGQDRLDTLVWRLDSLGLKR